MKTYEAWVSSFVANLSNYFNLQGWTIKVDFVDEEHKDAAYALTGFNSDYLWAHITFYKPAKADFENQNFDQLIMATVHEMVHFFLDPIHDLVTPHLSKTTDPFFRTILEQQTQRLTRVFLKTLPKSLIPPRPNGKHNRTPADNKS